MGNTILRGENFGKNIMLSNRHQFIYGRNGIEREEFLRNLAANYPFKIEAEDPIGIYISDKGLSELPIDYKYLNMNIINILFENYFDSWLAFEAINLINRQIDLEANAERINEFLQKLNNILLSRSNVSLKSLKELEEFLRTLLATINSKYEDYIKNGIFNGEGLKLLYIDSTHFFKDLREAIGSKRHFDIIIDEQTPLATKMQQVINGLVNSRINGIISMKVSCDPDSWKTYCDVCGNYIQRIHDYESIEFDDSSELRLERIKAERMIKFGEED
jgi:hypothetical protein